MHSRKEWRFWASLLALALVTRLPLWGPSPGEPDSGCILVDVWLWIGHWPHLTQHNFVYGYFPILSPGYFAFWGRLGRWLAIPGPHLGYWLNGANLAAEIAAAPLIYLVGRRFLSPAAAWTAALLYLLAPAYWWLGLEAHPEGLMILLALLALDQLLRARPAAAGAWAGRRLGHGVAAAVLFAGALLMRCDGILLLPVFAACTWLASPEAAGRSGWRALVATGAVGAAASLLFEIGQAAILGQSLPAANAKSVSVVTRFAMHSSLFHQLVPIGTAVGPAVFLFAAVGWGLLLWRQPPGHGRRALGLAVAALPGLLFWMPITGNVVRHVVALWLGLMWAGVAGWQRGAPRALIPAALLAVALNWLVLPPNSNVNVYPSPNVFASHRMSLERQAEVAAALPQLQALARTGAQPCYLGTGTNAFLVADALFANPPASVHALDDAWQLAAWPGGGSVWIGEAYTDLGYRRAWNACSTVISLEYAPPARHAWFVGGELRRSRLYATLEVWAHRDDMAAAISTRPPAAVAATQQHPGHP